jgi:hypothetical protein
MNNLRRFGLLPFIEAWVRTSEDSLLSDGVSLVLRVWRVRRVSRLVAISFV